MSPIVGSNIDGVAAIASLTQRFSSNSDAKKRAESSAPAR